MPNSARSTNLCVTKRDQTQGIGPTDWFPAQGKGDRMNRIFKNLVGSGYESRILSEYSPQWLFLYLLAVVFVLGALFSRAHLDAADLGLCALWSVIVFRDARIVYRVLDRNS